MAALREIIRGLLLMRRMPSRRSAASALPRGACQLCPNTLRFSLAPFALIGKNPSMTNKIAIALGLLVVAVFAVDAYAYEGALPVFLGKELFEFLDWIAFWR